MASPNRKIQLADQLSKAVGFQGLNDRESIVDRGQLEKAIPAAKKLILDILQEFKRGEIRTKNLRMGTISSPLDCIKLLRSVLRSSEISMGVATIKRPKRIKGKSASIYTYRLLGH